MHIGLCYAEPLGDPAATDSVVPVVLPKKFLSSFYLVL